jgi:hypothetical protein
MFCPDIYMEGLRRPRNPLFRTVTVPSEIRTKHLPNISKRRSDVAKLLGVKEKINICPHYELVLEFWVTDEYGEG